MLRDNGVVQRIDAVGTTDSAHVIVGLDVSHSVDGEALDQMRSAVRTLHGQLTHADRLSLLTFGNRLRHSPAGRRARAATWNRCWPAWCRMVRRRCTTRWSPGRRSREPIAVPPMFLLLTDGQDTGSWSTASAALDAIRHGHVVVYPIGAGLPRRSHGLGGLRVPARADLAGTATRRHAAAAPIGGRHQRRAVPARRQGRAPGRNVHEHPGAVPAALPAHLHAVSGRRAGMASAGRAPAQPHRNGRARERDTWRGSRLLWRFPEEFPA